MVNERGASLDEAAPLGRRSLRDRPTRGMARTNLIWVIGVAAGVVVGGIVAYGVVAVGPDKITSSR